MEQRVKFKKDNAWYKGTFIRIENEFMLIQDENNNVHHCLDVDVKVFLENSLSHKCQELFKLANQCHPTKNPDNTISVANIVAKPIIQDEEFETYFLENIYWEVTQDDKIIGKFDNPREAATVIINAAAEGLLKHL